MFSLNDKYLPKYLLEVILIPLIGVKHAKA